MIKLLHISLPGVFLSKAIFEGDIPKIKFICTMHGIHFKNSC